MRVGHQHFNLANLACCRRVAFELLHSSKRHAVYISPGHQHHSHYGYDYSGAAQQSDLSLSYADNFGRGTTNQTQNARDSIFKTVSRPQLIVDGKDGAGNTPLMRAALDGDTELVRELLSKGSDVNAQNAEGRTALMFAVINLRAASVNVLLEFGADVNAQAACGCTPLTLAAYSGDAKITHALLTGGADATRTCQSGKTAMVVAIEHGYHAVVELFKQAMGHTMRSGSEKRDVASINVVGADRLSVTRQRVSK